MLLLQNFPLCTRQLEKLKAAGFETVDDLRDVTVSELSNGVFILTKHLVGLIFLFGGGGVGFVCVCVCLSEMFVPNAEALEILDTVFGKLTIIVESGMDKVFDLVHTRQLQIIVSHSSPNANLHMLSCTSCNLIFSLDMSVVFFMYVLCTTCLHVFTKSVMRNC